MYKGGAFSGKQLFSIVFNMAPNYENTKIYKIVHKDSSVDSENMYVGSTVLKLFQRMAVHRTDARNGKMSNVAFWLCDIDPVNASIVLLESYPCASNEEKLARERYWVERLNPNLNMKRPYRTKEEANEQTRESRARNIESKRASDRIYYAKNAEKLKDYQKQYQEAYPEIISARKKAYRERNAELIKQRKRDYYKNNRDAIIERRKAKKELQ